MELQQLKFKKYLPLRGYDDDGDIDTATGVVQQHHFSAFVVAVFVALVVGAVAGYSVGMIRQRTLAHTKVHNTSTTTIRTSEFSFIYNRTFAEAPSPETDSAWESIFPPHGGFFQDPILAPNGGSLAVYHQLHCLDGIRHAYYVLLDAVMQGSNVTFSDLDDYSTDWHTRHCLDFLRQMLMCNADLTIEEVEPSLGGIKGFGRRHECVVWEDVKAWSVLKQHASDGKLVV